MGGLCVVLLTPHISVATGPQTSQLKLHIGNACALSSDVSGTWSFKQKGKMCFWKLLQETNSTAGSLSGTEHRGRASRPTGTTVPPKGLSSGEGLPGHPLNKKDSHCVSKSLCPRPGSGEPSSLLGGSSVCSRFILSLTAWHLHRSSES